jgi:hypothetical protein
MPTSFCGAPVLDIPRHAGNGVVLLSDERMGEEKLTGLRAT